MKLTSNECHQVNIIVNNVGTGFELCGTPTEIDIKWNARQTKLKI